MSGCLSKLTRCGRGGLNRQGARGYPMPDSESQERRVARPLPSADLVAVRFAQSKVVGRRKGIGDHGENAARCVCQRLSRLSMQGCPRSSVSKVVRKVVRANAPRTGQQPDRRDSSTRIRDGRATRTTRRNPQPLLPRSGMIARPGSGTGRGGILRSGMIARLSNGTARGQRLIGSRACPEVRRHRRHVLTIDDPVAVDILRAAVARALVADDLPEVRSVNRAVTVHVPHAR